VDIQTSVLAKQEEKKAILHNTCSNNEFVQGGKEREGLSTKDCMFQVPAEHSHGHSHSHSHSHSRCVIPE